MDALESRQRQFIVDLFAGPFPGHGIVISPISGEPFDPTEQDYPTSDRPIAEWTDKIVSTYEWERQWHAELGDDAVPFAHMSTHTGVFASAFGCTIQPFEGIQSAARPLVTTPAEADRLRQPGLDTRPMERFFELAELVRERLGPSAPIGVPDIQSPFDIAALVWNKEDMYVALKQDPDSVRRLVDKCGRLLTDFLLELKRRFPECNLIHYPGFWAPPDLGCSLSEDEAGCISVPTFEEHCLPWLARLSNTFGGLFMHCCASADHQYRSFLRIPKFRGIQRVFQSSGPRPAIEAFSGHCVLVMTIFNEAEFAPIMEMALPNTRFMFCLQSSSMDEAKGLLERVRTRCAKHEFRESPPARQGLGCHQNND